MIRNNQVEIFEDNQADLEAAVERLSGYLEHEVDENNVVANRANIIDRFMLVVYYHNHVFPVVIADFNLFSDIARNDAMFCWDTSKKEKRQNGSHLTKPDNNKNAKKIPLNSMNSDFFFLYFYILLKQRIPPYYKIIKTCQIHVE